MVRSQEDERKVLISLTEKGQALKQEAVRIPGEIMENFSGESFTMEEAAQFRQQMFKLIGVLEKKTRPTDISPNISGKPGC